MNQSPTADPLQQTYDQIPYASMCNPRTHPDVLAVTAMLSGLNPPPVSRCRVLEIGCASGGNLLPMAQTIPNGTFVGVDLSPKQIDAARAMAAAAGLKNVRFETLNLLDLTPQFGQFDYIIAHGVYSWVPAEVQDGLLRVIQQNMAPGGVAFISFSTYPGMHMRMMVREMMQYHTRGMTDPKAIVEEARRLIEVLHDSVAYPPQKGQNTYPHSYGYFIRTEAEMLRGFPDSYIAHDHLEAANIPVYFHQFAEHLAAHGLQYLGEADPNPLRKPSEIAIRTLFPQIADDRIAVQQYVDFKTGLMFRMSLIVAAEHNLREPADGALVEGLQVRALLDPPQDSAEVQSQTPVVFTTRGGTPIAIKEPLAKAVLVNLARAWPRAMSFNALLENVRSELQEDASYAAPGTSDRAIFARMILSCSIAGLMELTSYVPVFTLTVSDKPKALLLARVQARDSQTVANLLHHRIADLTRLDRVILAHLSGTRDRAALLEGVRTAIAKKILPDPSQNDAAASEAGFTQSFEYSLEQSLARIAERVLLVG